MSLRNIYQKAMKRKIEMLMEKIHHNAMWHIDLLEKAIFRGIIYIQNHLWFQLKRQKQNGHMWADQCFYVYIIRILFRRTMKIFSHTGYVTCVIIVSIYYCKNLLTHCNLITINHCDLYLWQKYWHATSFHKVPRGRCWVVLNVERRMAQKTNSWVSICHLTFITN